jgi:hypothetical protein
MKNFDMSGQSGYSTPTHFVELPSKGRFYPEGHPLRNVAKVELFMMTTRHEDILTNPSYMEEGVVVERLIDNLIVDPSLRTKDILEGDQTAILFGARQNAYGNDYDIFLVCDACTHEFNHIIDLSKVFEEKKDEGTENKFEITPDGTIVVTLPKTNSVVEYRILSLKDEEGITNSIESKKKHKLPVNEIKERFMRAIVSIDGDSGLEKRSHFIDNMPLYDSRYFQARYIECYPRINNQFEILCPNSKCDHVLKGGLPVQASFFWPNV